MSKLRTALIVSLLLVAIMGLLYFENPHDAWPAWNSCSTPERQSDGPEVAVHEWTVELTIRMPTTDKMIQRFFCEAMRSAVLFWSPKFGPVRLLLDEEDRGTDFPSKIQDSGLPYRFLIDYMARPANERRFARAAEHVKKSIGYMRQLHDSYLMDLYTNASVIAWTDTDTIFTTIVTPKRISSDGKLIVKGMNTFNRLPWVNGWDRAARVQLGLPMVSDFMVYFPVYLFPRTIRKCREWIMKKFKRKCFEDAFVDSVLSGDPVNVSPVSVILSYAYYYERDLYEWHLDTGPGSLRLYNNRFTGVEHHVGYIDTYPELHVTVHSGYYADYNTVLSQTFCSVTVTLGLRNAGDCLGLPESRQLLLYEFSKDPEENHLSTWCAGEGRNVCLYLLLEHERDMKSWHSSHPELLQKDAAVYLETFAEANFEVTCPKDVY